MELFEIKDAGILANLLAKALFMADRQGEVIEALKKEIDNLKKIEQESEEAQGKKE